ncbi:UNVERIFIED_CONTAM: hypothetical protein FKN15_001398 [Acipenser sinensis]
MSERHNVRHASMRTFYHRLIQCSSAVTSSKSNKLQHPEYSGAFTCLETAVCIGYHRLIQCSSAVTSSKSSERHNVRHASMRTFYHRLIQCSSAVTSSKSVVTQRFLQFHMTCSKNKANETSYGVAVMAGGLTSRQKKAHERNKKMKIQSTCPVIVLAKHFRLLLVMRTLEDGAHDTKIRPWFLLYIADTTENHDYILLPFS